MLPMIGITCAQREVPSSAGEDRAHVLYATYSAMVRAAGGVPVVLVPSDGIDELVARIDGLVLSGGGDVDPTRYGGPGAESVYGVDRERDEFEIALARAAAAQRLPTLAVCRGMQVVNVAFGGTLIADIPTAIPGAEQHRRRSGDARLPVQRVTLEAGSAVATALGSTEVLVNSIHHQAIDEVGTGLRVTGRAGDGLPEAMEAAEWPLWGVQWHPEWLGRDDGPSLRLFRTLVEAASG
jgi:putative glutamine amidotransferase